MNELQRNWDLFGKTDPLWSILTDPRGRNRGWNEEEFFESGRKDIETVFDRLQALGVRLRPGRALDFGCGVGRLAQALCDRFDSVVGVDIAPSMIELAKRYNRFGTRCEYAVNDTEDLSRFADGTFDFAFTLIVLQHMVPRYSRRYIAELLRVTAIDGILVFQVPSASNVERPRRLPRNAFLAQITAMDATEAMPAGRKRLLRFRVTNASPRAWPWLPAGKPMALTLGNHWLDRHGAMQTLDDARTPLGQALAPGETKELQLEITAPALPGSYILEVDLVQEAVSWFGRRGSSTWRRKVEVSETDPSGQAQTVLPPLEAKMEMHCLRRSTVEQLVVENGGELLDVVEHGSCGEEYENYQYYVRKQRRVALFRHITRPFNRATRTLLDHAKKWRRSAF